MAASLFQPPQDRKGEFFIESPQKIFAFLMAYEPTPDELVQWMSNPDEIDRRLKGTEHAHLIDPRAHQQRAGVLGSLGLVADSLRLLPKREEGNGAWTATEWAEKRQGWVFITSLPAEREALRPLQSLWIDWLVLRLLNEPTKEQKRVWFVIDELASLQKLPQLHTAITEGRKGQNPVVLGFQGKAQLEYLYGHLAEVMLSQPATSVWLTTKEPNAGEWVSKFIGKVEIERLRETHFDGTRAGHNFTIERQVEPLVLESEISGLPDLHAFMKYQNYVTFFSFPYFDMPVVAKPLVNEYEAILGLLKEPYRTMVIVAQCLGLRVSEIAALQWEDFDFERQQLLVQRSIVNGQVDDVKTEYSRDHVPLHEELVEVLLEWSKEATPTEEGWVFASPLTNKPYQTTEVQKRHLRPAGWCLVECPKCGVGSGVWCRQDRPTPNGARLPIHEERRVAAGKFSSIGWHTFRHTYRSWLDETGAPMKVQQELMRHASIQTTMNVYGQAMTSSKREANGKVVEMVLKPVKASA